MPHVSVEVDGLRELVRDLERAGVDINDIKDAFARIAAEGARVGEGFTPRRSGRLADTARGNRAKGKAVLTWGKAAVPYAGPILWGHPRRGIKPARTIARTDDVMAARAPAIFDEEIEAIFRKHGFNS